MNMEMATIPGLLRWARASGQTNRTGISMENTVAQAVTLAPEQRQPKPAPLPQQEPTSTITGIEKTVPEMPAAQIEKRLSEKTDQQATQQANEQQLPECIPAWSTSALLSIAIFIAGVAAGYQTRLRLDRRQEFNQAAKPVRQWLLNRIQSTSPGFTRLSIIELDAFTSELSSRELKRWTTAWEKYKAEEKDAQLSSGGILPNYLNPEPIREALRACLLLTKRH